MFIGEYIGGAVTELESQDGCFLENEFLSIREFDKDFQFYELDMRLLVNIQVEM